MSFKKNKHNLLFYMGFIKLYTGVSAPNNNYK